MKRLCSEYQIEFARLYKPILERRCEDVDILVVGKTQEIGDRPRFDPGPKSKKWWSVPN